MFEKMEEYLKDAPDWLEVSFPPGTIDDLTQKLKPTGLTPEKAVQHFIDCLQKRINKVGESMMAFEVSAFAIDDLIGMLRNEQIDSFYKVELPDYSLPAFATFNKGYFGTFAEIAGLLGSLKDDTRKNLGDITLTPVPIMASRTAHKDEYEVEHLNTYRWPHLMKCKSINSIHVWIKYGEKYLRCLRACVEDLRCESAFDEEPLPIEHSWGFPNMMGFLQGCAFNRLFAKEKTFDTWEEAEKDIREFDGDIILTEFFNDIFGDG